MLFTPLHIPMEPVPGRWRLSDDKYRAEKRKNSIFDHPESLAAQTSLVLKICPKAEKYTGSI